MQLKVLMVCLVGFLFAFNLPQTVHGEDLGRVPSPIVKKLVTPDMQDSLFRRIKGYCAKQNREDKSIWEPDHSSHGGEQWKRWNNKRDWRDPTVTPTSVWLDGRIRKAPKS